MHALNATEIITHANTFVGNWTPDPGGCHVVVVGNEKGGTGKSTTISAMAGRAEEAGLRVVSVFPNAARADTAMGALSLAFGRELAESGGHESHLRLAGSDDLDVLAIDDIHLMDRPGVDAVCHIIEQTGIAVVMTHAAEAPIVDELARTLDRLQVDVVRLDNLAPNDVAELARHVLGEDLAPAAAEEVVRLTGGNPRLITHLLRAARDEDTLAASAEGV